MAELPTLFADGVLEASIRHGVARLKLAVQDTDGKPAPSGLLVIPLAQLPGVAGTLTRLLREVEAKTREAQTAGPAAEPAGKPAPGPEEPPVTFRFQG
ncbi:hypothetical protein [Roseomonas xinghualingensis]|uniref:hypothetical protein n=1 Tax=Roseomonas xinghualingensis TaxID=2986475 RepID=UPI0021F12926|nr:hypothetical protein [Roseomonas sp. SXEYE001]MCV4209127.1 hypothetical protein [Roseomonas sp. SXEYE001]